MSTRPVRVLYPYAAGSSGDTTARLITRRLNDALGQPFVVENRTGANGIIATEAVVRASADGYTLLWATMPQIAIAPAMSKVPYDPVKDFAPISAICSNSFALAVNPRLPVRTGSEFVDYARGQPGGFAYAEGGAGSLSHLAMVLLLDRAGLKGTNVSYKGSMQALTDVVAGHLPAMFSVLGDALSQAQGGAVPRAAPVAVCQVNAARRRRKFVIGDSDRPVRCRICEGSAKAQCRLQCRTTGCRRLRCLCDRVPTPTGLHSPGRCRIRDSPSACSGKACPCEGEGGYRFSDKNMRQRKRSRAYSGPFDRNML
jgi:hypothetical protein